MTMKVQILYTYTRVYETTFYKINLSISWQLSLFSELEVEYEINFVK